MANVHVRKLLGNLQDNLIQTDYYCLMALEECRGLQTHLPVYKSGLMIQHRQKSSQHPVLHSKCHIVFAGSSVLDKALDLEAHLIQEC